MRAMISRRQTHEIMSEQVRALTRVLTHFGAQQLRNLGKLLRPVARP
jgi:hypothetical protein